MSETATFGGSETDKIVEEAFAVCAEGSSQTSDEDSIELAGPKLEQDYAAFHAVASILNHSLELDKLLFESLEEVVTSFGVEGAAIFLRSRKHDTYLELYAHYGLNEPLIQALIHNPPAPALSPAWATVLSGAPACCLNGDTPWSSDSKGLTPSCLLPLDGSERPKGVLVIFRRRPVLCRLNLSVLSDIAKQIGLAIEKSRLYDLAKKQAAEMESLYDASVELSRSIDSKSRAKVALMNALKLSGAKRGTIFFVNKRGRLTLADAYPRETALLVPTNSKPPEGTAASWILKNFEPLTVNATGVDNGIRMPPWLENARNYIGIPLFSRRQVLGFMELTDKTDGPFTTKDLKLLETLAHQAAVLIDNAQLLEEKSSIADILQRNLLPSRPEMPDLEVGSCYASATARAAVGGDFYDFFEVGKNKIAVICGDVCGKGIEAATTTAMVRYLLRSLVSSKTSPSSVINRLNRALATQLDSCQFVTIFYALYDRKEQCLTWVNCGHPPAVLWKRKGSTMLLESQDIPLGLFTGTQFHQGEVDFDIGDVLLLYTDGVIEAKKDKEFFGQERLLSVVAEHAPKSSAEVMARALYLASSNFASSLLNDDLAIVTVRRQS